MNKISEALKKFFSKNTLTVIRNFVVKYRRFFFAGILLVAVILILIFFTGKSKKDSSGEESLSETETTEVAEISLEDFVIDTEYEQDQDAALNALITNYFAAYADADIETLKNIAYPMTDNEASYITMLSEYIESFDSVSCYTMHGLETGSYLVNAYAKIKFVGVETGAPTLEFFYVRTDADGNYYIDNIYSNYNYTHLENPLDDNINSVIEQFKGQEAVSNLRAQVQTEYNDACTSDSDLNDMLTVTIKSAIRLWAENLNTTSEDTQTQDTQVEDTQTDESQTDESQTDESQTDDAQTEDDQEEQTITVQIIVTDVNIRDAASTDSNVLGKANEGDSFTKVGEDGDWTIIDYNGTNAYIKTEFVSVM